MKTTLKILILAVLLLMNSSFLSAQGKHDTAHKPYCEFAPDTIAYLKANIGNENNAKAQNKNLNSLPKVERDSILLTVAKEAMLKYAPEWYDESLTVDIKYFGYSKREEDKHRVIFDVVYKIRDKSKIPDSWDFIAKVGVWEDTGKALGIVFGPGWSISELDEQPETRGGTTVEQITYTVRRISQKMAQPH